MHAVSASEAAAVAATWQQPDELQSEAYAERRRCVAGRWRRRRRHAGGGTRHAGRPVASAPPGGPASADAAGCPPAEHPSASPWPRRPHSPALRRSLRAGWLNHVVTLSCHFFLNFLMEEMALFTMLPCPARVFSGGCSDAVATWHHRGAHGSRARAAGPAPEQGGMRGVRHSLQASPLTSSTPRAT